MAAEGLSLGASLPVPNVQALAASGDLVEIPDRYIRPELEAELIWDGNAGKIPVVDLGRLLEDSLSHAEAGKLRSACEDWGFFQLVNHGVPEELIGRMKAAVEEFFDQPLDKKMASSKKPPGSLEGYGQAFVLSEEQKLDWADTLSLVTQPPALRNLQLWPIHPANFRETLEEYSRETKRVALHLLRLMAENLGLPPQKLTGHFTDGWQAVSMNYYPPCRHHAEKVLGISPHSDGGALTLFLQASPVPGLQIKRKGGWVAVNPLTGAFVVNIGDILEIMTNGRYKSIEHRAVVDRERRRITVVTFCSPSTDARIGPLRDLAGVDAPLYKTLSWEEYYRLRISTKLDGKMFLDNLKLTH